METSLAHEIVEKLKGAHEVYLVLHRGPDPDSMGSAGAFAVFLKAHAISYRFYCQTALSSEAQFFGIDQDNLVNSDALYKALGNAVSQGYRMVFCVFDAGDLAHAGLASLPTFAVRPMIINFDHHATNTRFGAINVIDVGCASTTEVVYHFFSALRVLIAPRTASYLLAGLLTDTDHFFNPGTTSGALQMAADLLNRGITLSALRELLFERRNLQALRLIGEILSRLKKNVRYGIAITYVTEEDARRHGVVLDEIQDMANILNALDDAKAMVVVKSQGGIVRVSMRTTRTDVDLARLAERLGGGGHRKAAGFRVHGALSQTEKGLQII